jgi:hypothetical protein
MWSFFDRIESRRRRKASVIPSAAILWFQSPPVELDLQIVNNRKAICRSAHSASLFTRKQMLIDLVEATLRPTSLEQLQVSLPLDCAWKTFLAPAFR